MHLDFCGKSAQLFPRKPRIDFFVRNSSYDLPLHNVKENIHMKTVTLFEKSEKSGYLFLAIPSLWWRNWGLFASLTKTGQRQIIVWVEYLQKKLIPKDSLRNGNYVVHVGKEWRWLWMICRSIEAPTPLVLPEGLQCSLPSRTEYYEQESFLCFYLEKSWNQI